MPSRPFPHLRRRELLAAAGALTLAGTARASAAPVRIGQSLPLTGPIAGVVGPITQGQAALLESVNAEGGVHGAKIELITLDDARSRHARWKTPGRCWTSSTWPACSAMASCRGC